MHNLLSAKYSRRLYILPHHSIQIVPNKRRKKKEKKDNNTHKSKSTCLVLQARHIRFFFSPKGYRSM